MTLIEQLLIVADAYGSARNISRARVSTLVLNDGKRLAAIARGGDLRTSIFERAMVWFSANWPKGAPWPSGVNRPEPPPNMPQPPVSANSISAEVLP